ncbi:MAG: hypothetical protein ACI8O8_002639 [Oleiphilaceae bacterium]|jgi:hypothetical protein
MLFKKYAFSTVRVTFIWGLLLTSLLNVQESIRQEVQELQKSQEVIDKQTK